MDSMPRRLWLAIVVWLALIGADFVLNAALFARMYASGGTFFLPANEAFRRIPLGYAAFLVLALAVVELETRLGITDVVSSVRLGLFGGAALGVSWALGLYSIATLSAEAALAFAAIWLVLFVVASVVGALGRRSSLRRLAAGVIGADIIGFLVVVILQSAGVVPTVTM